MESLRIRKCRRITGRTIALRNATVEDAEFIVALRSNRSKNKHLARPVSLDDQIAYLKRYQVSDDQAYFIVESPEHQPLGTVRLYDQQASSFSWGSWLVAEGAPANTAIESALIVYCYGFEALGFDQAHFDVRIDNERVWRFHERFGATLIRTDERDRFYVFGRTAWEAARVRFGRFLPDGIEGCEPIAEELS